MSDSKAIQTAKVPVWEKYSLTIWECAEYFGIGEKKIRQLIKNNPNADYVLKIGNKTLVKRRSFENYLEQATYL